MGTRITALLLVAGCGRLDFGVLADADAKGGDAAGRDGGVSACPPSALLCDDFETGDLSKWATELLSTGGTTVVDAVSARAGAFGLDATMPAQGNGAISAVCANVTAPAMLAIREWLFAPVGITNFDAPVLMTSGTSCTDSAPMDYVTIDCDATQTIYLTEYKGINGSDHPIALGCPPPMTWTCVELDYTLGAPPELQMYVGDTLLLATPAAEVDAVMTTASVGVTRADAAGFQVYVDDVVIATEHIGCT